MAASLCNRRSACGTLSKLPRIANAALNHGAFVTCQHARSLHIFRQVAPLRQHRRKLLLDGASVGLVPTMGALHEGHMSLIRRAAAENSRVFVTIYVNPTQFGINEDLDSYPKTWESDLAKLQALNAELENSSEGARGRVDTIFAPASQTMYPGLPPDSSIPGTGSFVTITPLGQLLEGASRPVFFRGVATVCMKLFNIVEAEKVYFGQKDVQQTVVVDRMIKDFHLNTELRIVATEREADGLAMSSRNVYLGERRRKVGIVLRESLRAAEEAYTSGKRSRAEILGPAQEVAMTAGVEQDAASTETRARFEVDYISLADPATLEEIEQVDEQRGAVLSGAIKMLPLEVVHDHERLGLGDDKVQVRLIDNIILRPANRP